MGKEILFRGMRVLEPYDWVYGFFLKSAYDGRCFILNNPIIAGKINSTPIEVIPNTIGQYTNINDKHGVKIFEGNIVKCYITDKSAPYLQLEANKENYVIRKITMQGVHQEGLPDDCEVIGNIYEESLKRRLKIW